MPSPSPSTDEFCFKLQKLASRHQQMKVAYHDLKSQINAGLLEAEEVFASLAIPLLKLVGLKTKEMADDGRFSTIIIDNGYSHGLESQSSDATGGGEQDYLAAASEGENYATRATMAGRELVEKQHENLAQLIHLLRQIENHVNCEQDGMLENLEKHRLYLHKYFHKAISCIFALGSQNKETSFIIHKLLQDILKNVNAVLGSLESGVNSLIEGLAEKMCNPMVEYVKGVRDDMKKGTSRQLLGMLKEMERMMRRGKLELEDAKKKVIVAEKEKIEALCKLKLTEERLKRTKQQFSLPEPQRRCIDSSGHATSHMFLGMQEEQIKDDKLLWTLLNNKRKDGVTSPMGPEGLRGFNTNKRCARPSLEYTRITRSRTKALGLQNSMLK